jgi:hypothetical protein
MNDMLPADSPLWEWFEAIVADWLRATATGRSAHRSSSRTELFVRGIGEVTDIVEKEMYSFDRQAERRRLTLRPEGTAGVVRAASSSTTSYNGRSALWYDRTRCSATNGRRRAATGSSTRSTSKRSALPARHRRRTDRDAARALARSSALDSGHLIRSRSTRLGQFRRARRVTGAT